MASIELPYGKSNRTIDVPDARLNAVLESRIAAMPCAADEDAEVLRALREPIGAKPLSELARGKRRVTILASDHTRPVPSKRILPHMIGEIRAGSPDAVITVLIATGCHRETTQDELIEKLGETLYRETNVIVHDCDDEAHLVTLGTLPSGGICRISSYALDCDLLVSEGFIEPHFFAGFSGGRKSVLPGIAARETVVANHCAAFIDSEYARTGKLDGNPIHRDMVWAARQAKLRFIVNVVLSPDKRIVKAFAGDPEAAHAAGCSFLSELCGVARAEADIAVTTNGGYPLDQNAYQTVKGMTAAEATVRQGGVIILFAECADGIGGEAFFRQLADEPDGEKTVRLFLSRAPQETAPDQWQTQILLRVLRRASVIFVSSLDDETVEKLHMLPAHSFAEALDKADEILGTKDGRITVIPDGVSVIVRD